MPVRGIQRVKANFANTVREISEERSERAVYEILSTGRALSDVRTPVDTSTLINSGYIDIQPGEGKVSGRVGYTAAYAEAVHESPGTLKGKPREDFGMTSNHSDAGPQVPFSFGGGTGSGNYWDPNAEPQFLSKGLEEAEPKIPGILRRNYKV